MPGVAVGFAIEALFKPVVVVQLYVGEGAAAEHILKRRFGLSVVLDPVSSLQDATVVD